ncbi:unnamed protein product [Discosporangium mesarthrocarpum]
MEPGVTSLRSNTVATAAALLVVAGPMMMLSVHAEPWNALSLPTWMVHVSSLIEWLVAMAYVWKYAEAVGMSEWKGLTWGMAPLHVSGLCACAFHVFYNSPQLNALVPLQASLTCFGNATMAWAAWRIWKAGQREAEGAGGARATTDAVPVAMPALKDEVVFYGKIALVTVLGAALVKYGELFLDFPFEPTLPAALAVIGLPSLYNFKVWWDRSNDPSADFEAGFL